MLILLRGRPRAGGKASGKAIGWNRPPREDRSTVSAVLCSTPCTSPHQSLAGAVGALSPTCLVLCPFVGTPPTVRFCFCPSASAFAEFCFARVYHYA